MGSGILLSARAREQLARNVRELLRSLEWSENELAHRSGVSQKQINNLTHARTGCGIDALEAIAAATHCEAWQLIHPDFLHVIDNLVAASQIFSAYARGGPAVRDAMRAAAKKAK